MNIRTTITEIMEKEERKAKTSFWASDCERNRFDIYHNWLGTDPTNPPEVEQYVMWDVAKMVEMGWVQRLQDAGELKKLEDINPAKLKDDQYYISIEREGVPITGKLDGITKDGYPFECKTYYGHYHYKDLANAMPKISYCKQLAVYMDALKVDRGVLFMVDRGNGKFFQFTQTLDHGVFRCGNVEFTLDDDYKMFSEVYNDNILKDVEPKSDFIYKIPVDKLDFSKISKADIAKMRNNKMVYGDWQVKYSNYKDMIVEREGSDLGYTPREIDYILTNTKGYSSR